MGSTTCRTNSEARVDQRKPRKEFDRKFGTSFCGDNKLPATYEWSLQGAGNRKGVHYYRYSLNRKSASCYRAGSVDLYEI